MEREVSELRARANIQFLPPFHVDSIPSHSTAVSIQCVQELSSDLQTINIADTGDSITNIETVDPLIITNTRGSTIAQFGIVGLGEGTTSPQDDYATFAEAVYVDSAAPGNATRFAVVLKDVAIGATSPAVASGGPVQVKVNRTSAAHNYAGSTSGNYDYLTSGTSGIAEITAVDNLPALAIGETVHEGSGVPDSGLGSDGDYYKDTVGEQYYGPKAAGAWGSANDYKTGICWAFVVLDLSGSGSDSFKTIAVFGQSDVVADSATDTLTLADGDNVEITTNATTDMITISVPDIGITSINGETGPAVTLRSADGSVVITEPVTNEIDFSVPTPFVLGTGSLTDTAATLSGSGTFTPIVYGGALVDSASLLAGTGTYTPPTFTGTGALVATPAVIACSGFYTGLELFVAKMTAPIMQASSNRWVYAWVEQEINSTTGDYQDLSGGRSGTTASGPFMQERNNVLTCTPVYSLVRQRGNFNGQRLYDFEHCCDIGIAFGSGSLVAGIDTLSGVGTFYASGIVSGIGDLIAGVDTLSGTGVFGAATVTGTGVLVAQEDTLSGVGVFGTSVAGSGSLVTYSATLAGVGEFGVSSAAGTGSLVAGIDTLSGVGEFYTDTEYTGEGGIALGGIYRVITDIPTQGGIALGGTYT